MRRGNPSRWQGAVGGSAALLCLLVGPSRVQAQAPLAKSVRINSNDLAVLEAREVRKDLNCTVYPVKPELGFDLRFHSGFDISLPLSEVATGICKASASATSSRALST